MNSIVTPLLNRNYDFEALGPCEGTQVYTIFGLL
jgi:hypothetical protein